MTPLLFRDIEAVRDFENQLANDSRNFARIIKHLNSAPDSDEAHLRFLALRVVQRTKPPAFEPSNLAGRQIIRFNHYESELHCLQVDQRAASRHREKLKRRGIPLELWFLHPYQSPNQRRRQRERLLYIRQCLKDGEPIQWPNS